MPGGRAQGGPRAESRLPSLLPICFCSRTCEGTSCHSSERLEQTSRPLDDTPVMISVSLQRCLMHE